MAERPVNVWTTMTQNHIAVPPACPPAFRNNWAAGKPVGLPTTESRSSMQKHMVMVRIHPRIPLIVIDHLIAFGPWIAALWVSSDIWVVAS
jgi:hypothetical protein